MERIQTDLAIIGAGPAGLAAAITGLEHGLQVAVFEKSGVAGGTANMGMGPFGVESRVQKANMIGITREEAFEKFMDYVHWAVDARLVREYFWRSGETIDWLEDMGVQFDIPQKYYPESAATWHVVRPLGGGAPGPRCAGAMTKVMYERALELGAVFHFNAPVQRLLRDGDYISGFEALGEDGTVYQVEAGATLIATGGFGNNPDMIREHCGFTWGEDIFNFRIPGVDGDGLKMAWAAGAARGHMEMEGNISTKMPITDFPANVVFRQASALVVNQSGARVMNEAVLENTAVAKNVILRQKERYVYAILTDEILAHFRRSGLDFANGVVRSDPTQGFEAAVAGMAADWPDALFAADSLEDLAAQTGIRPAALRETVEAYNQSCALHYDDVFCKSRRYLHPIRGTRFYALKLFQGGYGSLGGIVVNHRCEVLDERDEPLLGLYAAGSDVCDLYAGTYLYYFPGNTMGFAINSGRIAAESAAQDLS